MRRVKVAFALLLAVTVIGGGGLAPATSALAESPVNVSLNAPAEVAPDSDFTVTIDITTVANFDACNYDVSFDRTVLRLDKITAGSIGATTIPVTMYNQFSPGTYAIAQNIPGLAGVTGSGYLAVLYFHVIGTPGKSSDITLSNGTLGNNLAKNIPATWAEDSVSVISPQAQTAEQPPPAVPSPEPEAKPVTPPPTPTPQPEITQPQVEAKGAEQRAPTPSPEPAITKPQPETKGAEQPAPSTQLETTKPKTEKEKLPPRPVKTTNWSLWLIISAVIAVIGLTTLFWVRRRG